MELNLEIIREDENQLEIMRRQNEELISATNSLNECSEQFNREQSDNIMAESIRINDMMMMNQFF